MHILIPSLISYAVCPLAFPGNNYDINGVAINTHVTVERPPTNVQNVNLREVRHNMGGDKKNMADGGDGKYRGVDRGDDANTSGSMYAPSL